MFIPDPHSPQRIWVFWTHKTETKFSQKLNPWSRIQGVKKHRIPDPDLGPATLVTTNKMAGGGSRFLERSSGTAGLGPLYICAKIDLFQRTG